MKLDLRDFCIRTDSHPAQYAAIAAGAGIGVLQVAVGVRIPSLVRVLPDHSAGEIGIWIVVDPDLRRLPKVLAAFDWLVDEFHDYLSDDAT